MADTPTPTQAAPELRAAAQAALEALTCDDGLSHRCGHCDDYVDRNDVVRNMLRAALERSQPCRYADMCNEDGECANGCADRAARAALEQPAGTPAGYALVPLEPTEAMHAAAVKTAVRCTGNADFPPRVWRAMIAAAPQQPGPTGAPSESSDEITRLRGTLAAVLGAGNAGMLPSVIAGIARAGLGREAVPLAIEDEADALACEVWAMSWGREPISDATARIAARLREHIAELAGPTGASTPTVIPKGWRLVPDHADADAVVTALYRRFKDWRKRNFGPDDVTWCEVRADVLALIGMLAAAPGGAGEPEQREPVCPHGGDAYHCGWSPCITTQRCQYGGRFGVPPDDGAEGGAGEQQP